MYDLPYHKEHDAQAIRDFIARHPFALLTGCDAHMKPVATQVPLFLEEDEDRLLLIGHVMKRSDHYRAFEQNEQVLAVFTGSHTYVSGSWYAQPHTPSTWNYMSVHARGRVRLLEGEAIEHVLRKTSLHFEKGNRESPTAYDNIPDEYKRMALRAVAAIEIEVDDIDTVFKLSQDQDVESYRNIIEQLKGHDENAGTISVEMENRFEKLFSDK
jgi:transcriptional regulator